MRDIRELFPTDDPVRADLPRDPTIKIGDVRGGYELAMQADRLRHEDAVERLRSTAMPIRSQCAWRADATPIAGLPPRLPAARST
jgi:hypothetical protein